MGDFTEDALRQVISRYLAQRDAALRERDARLRDFIAAGWRPADLQRVTGYSRETIRQALNPKARETINANRRETVAARRNEGRSLFVLPATLDELEGPTTGVVSLPPQLAGSIDPTYDLDRRSSMSRMYEQVMYEASSVDDLRDWLHQDMVIKLWPGLGLSPRLRTMWNRRFPVLANRFDYVE